MKSLTRCKKCGQYHDIDLGQYVLWAAIGIFGISFLFLVFDSIWHFDVAFVYKKIAKTYLFVCAVLYTFFMIKNIFNE